jgi:hypothetical protein
MFVWSKWDVLWESHDLNESERGEREREKKKKNRIEFANNPQQKRWWVY